MMEYANKQPKEKLMTKIKRMYEKLISGWEGSPPNGWTWSDDYHQKGYFDGISYYLSFLEDAFCVGIGVKEYDKNYEKNKVVVNEKWEVIMTASIFRKMAFWYLWRWAVGEWFGLRRWLYYRNLHKKVEGYKNIPVSSDDNR